MAVRDKNSIFVSWRALTSDSASTAFNIYKSVNGGAAVKLNNEPITNSSNYTDKSADVTKSNTYYIRTVNNGKEGSKSESYTLEANAIDGPVKVIPIKNGTKIKSVTVGDFNGDGNYDYLVSRASENHQLLEAYLNDGTYLWTIDLGKNSENKNNISPGASTIDVGHWDGATVYDINGDGKAEVLLRIANDVTFGDKTKFTYKNDVNQWFAVIDGMTGSCKDKAPIPDDYIADGPLGAQVGIGYLDGKKPSLVAVLKNRQKNKAFNMIVASYSYTNGKFQMDWKWKRGNLDAADGHHFRIADVNNDGKDEILEIGFCLNGDGTLRYSLDSVVHGDRFYVGKFNKDDKVMMGYGIQQKNPSGLLEYYYNASTGKIVWEHKSNSTEPVDVGRGAVGDIDPTQDGLEAWSFSGIYNAKSNKLLSNAEKTLWPSISFRWDGDLLSESYNDGKIEKWDYKTKSVSRVLTCSKIHSTVNDGGLVIGYGDIFGDWREEVICTNSNYNELVIYTTNIETQYKIPCLAQDRAYRNCMTLKGYKQSHMTGFYIGADRTDYSSEFKGTSGSSSEPESTIKTGAQIKEGKYRIKNLRSGLYLDVTDGKAANGTNVQQWAGSSDPASYNTWSLKSQGNGYYKIYSEVGDKQYLLDLDYGKTDNGTNIQIYKDTNSDAQQFKFVSARDNSYIIYTKATNDTSCLDVYESSSSNGANICEWEYNGGKNQMWLLEEVTDSSTGGNSGDNNSSSNTGTANNNILIDYKYNNWGTSFQNDFTITNKGSIACTTWRLKLKASDFDITSSWNVDVAKSGSDVIITPASWQAALSPNASASFGIISNGASKDTISYTVDFMDENGKVIATSSK